MKIKSLKTRETLTTSITTIIKQHVPDISLPEALADLLVYEMGKAHTTAIFENIQLIGPTGYDWGTFDVVIRKRG